MTNVKSPSSWSDRRTYYQLLGLHPSASLGEIRRSYREQSKRLHPDTSKLSRTLATEQFQRLNSAYAILSNPEQRRRYDHQIGYAQFASFAQPLAINQPQTTFQRNMEAEYGDRPLSSGENFAIFMMGVTFLGCFALALVLGFKGGHQ
jgi:curved DNA-binding protein CbpA